jgi:hypothetical protein
VLKSKQKKRKTKNLKLGGEVSQTGGAEVNPKTIQVRVFIYFIILSNNYLFCIELDLEKVMSVDEKKKLYEAIGYAGDDTSTSTYPEEVCSLFSSSIEHVVSRVARSRSGSGLVYLGSGPAWSVSCPVRLGLSQARSGLVCLGPGPAWSVSGPVRLGLSRARPGLVCLGPGPAWSVSGPVRLGLSRARFGLVCLRRVSAWSVSGPVRLVLGACLFL